MRIKKSFRTPSFFNCDISRAAVFISLILVAFLISYGIHISKQKDLNCKTCFSSAQDCLSVVIEAINKAEKTIQVQTYSFTSATVTKALIEAHKRGVKVIILTDKKPKTYPHTQIEGLIKNGVGVFFDTSLPVSHSKILIVDSQTVITGSYHFTNEEEQKNSENFLMITDKDIARQYSTEFNQRVSVSQRKA